MKAIHNADELAAYNAEAVFKEQKYDKWKQFTTYHNESNQNYLLFSKSKSTINESNSQLNDAVFDDPSAVF